MNEHYCISPNLQVLSLTSILDEWENRNLLRDLQQRINDGINQFVVDLAEVKIINSVGINFLLSLLSRVKKANGQLFLMNVSDYVYRLLDVTKLTSVFEMMTSADDAVLELEEETMFA